MLIDRRAPDTRSVPWWRLAGWPDWAVGGLFAAVYLGAVLLGRSTRPDGAPLAVVWPAAAVGFLWLAWAGGRRRSTTVIGALGILVLGGGMNALTGAGWLGGAILGAGGLAQALVGCVVMQRRNARASSPAWRLRNLEDLATLLIASYAGAVVAALIGIVAVTDTYDPGVLVTLVSWVLRLGTSTFVFTAVALRVVDHDLPTWAAPRGREAALMVTVLTGAYIVVFTTPVQLPLAFTMLPLSLWVALRFSTTVAAAHVIPVGAFVVVCTLDHRGPFGAAPEVSPLLAQAFITTIGAITLVFALHRDERAGLVQEVREAQGRAQEQAQLMSTVLAEMDEGIALVGSDGRFLLRNRAVATLMRGRATPDDQQPDPGALGIFNPDGTPCERAQMADARALAGERVEQDFLLRLADGTDRVLATRAAPLTTAAGDRRALVVFSDATAARRSAAALDRATTEVASARDLFAGVLDAATDLAIISTDVRGRVTVFNVGAERLLGYTAEAVLGRTPWFLHDSAHLARQTALSGVRLDVLLDGRPLDPDVLDALAPCVLGSRRWSLRTRTGRVVEVMTTTSIMRAEDGTVTGWMGASRDLTAELAAHADLAESEERFRLAFDTGPMGMIMVALTGGRTGKILQANPAMTRILGYGEAELTSMNVRDLTHPDDLELTSASLERHSTGATKQETVERRYLHRDGSTVWIRLSTSVVHPYDAEPYSMKLYEDITARKQAEEALTHQALHDALTGLPNRSLFRDRLEHALAAAGRTAQRVGVLYLDLDGFKAVNDSAGHHAGDQLLQRVSVLFTACIRPGDTLARIGGDEFAIVCPDLDSGDDAGAKGSENLQVIADRLLAAVQQTIDLPSGSFTVGVSIGTTLAGPGDTPEIVTRAADKAMYHAKRAGKNRIVAHSSP